MEQTVVMCRSHLLVYSEDPAPDVGRVRVRDVLDGEDLAVLLGAGVLRPERRIRLER